MIREFWVQNYRSIRDRQGLSFIAKGPESELVAKVADGSFIYKLGIFFGPNASGKSNILLALNEVFRLLVVPHTEASKEIDSYIPFALTKDQPTKMYVSFYADNIRYDYEVAFNSGHILKEELNYYPNGAKSLFYKRTFIRDDIQAEIVFGGSLHLQIKTQESIRENTLNNHSVLSVCLKNSFKEDIKPFISLHKWLMANYHEVDGDYAVDSKRNILKMMEKVYSDRKKHKFFSLMLQKADLNITDFRPIVEGRDVPKSFYMFLNKENTDEHTQKEIVQSAVKSIVFENRSESETFEISLKFQSKGTLKYIKILNVLYDLISDNHVYYLDELGEDLHYDLLFYYLDVFLYNSTQSQLLITSQETALLDQDLINENRGVVWFVEKNKDTASSEYNRGDSFGLHKNLSLYNSYFIGRLGAKPELGSIFIDLEE